jgi:autotransporter-associated beta strand protein
VANAMSIFNVRTMQTVTLSGNKTLNNATYTVDAGTTTTESGVLSGSGGITKAGTGTLLVTASNSFTGDTIVNAGVLNLNSATGSALGASTNVTVSATLLISQSGQVNDSAAVTLSGGTIQRASGVSEVFGNLNVTAASFLDYSGGTGGSLQFGGIDYTPSALLSLQLVNFTQGNSLVIQTGTDLTSYIGTGFTFSGAGGFGSSSFNGSTFTITAIPEPSTVIAAIGLVGLMLWPICRGPWCRARFSKRALAGKC